MSDINSGVIPSIEKDTSIHSNPSNPSNVENAKNAVVNSESQDPSSLRLPNTDQAFLDATVAANTIKNHSITQNLANGPLAENVKDQSAKTQADFSNLAATRTTPTTPAANGQQLTHYHSFFSSLLSWKHPRASGIAYASIVLFIFAARYLNILRYAFKLTYMTLAITVLAEAAGKALFSHGFVSQIRPRKYYTLPKESLDSVLSDVHELINFFVIESQRILFAENVFASGAAFLAAFISYYLIKIVPFWGLCLLSTSVLFIAPLIYKTNQELIDTHLSNVSTVVNQQTEQVKQLASHHAARAADTTKAYAADYSAKAQEMIGSARGRSTSPTDTKIPAPVVKSEDFPAAPKDEFKSNPLASEPLIST